MRQKRHEAIANSDQIGTDYERLLAASAQRRSRGIYYTPPAVVDFIVERTLAPLLEARSPASAGPLQVLDPACGCGAFLLGAHRWLCRWYARRQGRTLTSGDRAAIARRHLAGIDIDPAAVSLARQALALECGAAPQSMEELVRVGDALGTGNNGFDGPIDAVIMNPPYVNIRRLSQAQGSSLATAYRSRYRCAKGAFDLYVLFLERAIAALRPGGMLGAIVPNKLATLDYARECRELLSCTGSLESITDVSHLKLFAEAGVYPLILLWSKTPPPPRHAICIERPADLSVWRRSAPVAATPATYVLQAAQQASRGWMFRGELDVESRVRTVPLAQVCTLHSGATGFQAASLASRLFEAGTAAAGDGYDFITSGNIDPYGIRLGGVRFMGRQFARPLLPSADPILTDNKRRLYASPKIVLAGMSRRLEAAFDSRGLALGVQVYAATNWMIDPHYLLALLNSSLLSHLFRLRFAAKKLAGGYYSLSKRQLGQLPIRIADPDCPHFERRQHQLVRLVQQRIKSAAPLASQRLERQIDEIVMGLYRVAAGELTAGQAAA